jgi:hypothetical protein
LSVQEDLRLDANTEDFSSVVRFSVGPGGRLAVPQPQDLQVLLYDSTGKRLAAVGRRGSGPGEFRSFTSIGWVADTLWIHDGAQMRTTFVGPDGSMLRSTVLPETLVRSLSGGTGPDRLLSFTLAAVYADGAMLGYSRRQATGQAAQEAFGERVLVHVSPNGATRVVSTVPDEHDDRWFITLEGIGKNLPFAFRPQVAISSDGLRVAHLSVPAQSVTAGTWAVNVLRNGGDTLFSRSYPFVGVPIQRRILDSAVAAMAPPRGRPLEGPDLTERFQASARQRMPRVFAPVQSIVAGLDETVWVTKRDSGRVRETLVLNAKGDVIGRLFLTPTSRVVQASASRIWVAESDDDGLVSIVRYRVGGLRCRNTGCT